MCEHKRIVNMDHPANWPHWRKTVVNRICQDCRQHWYGPEGEVKEYTRAEWDALVNAA